MLPDDVLAQLQREARIRGSSMAEIVRDAVARHLDEPEPPSERRLGFIGMVEGGPADGSERVDAEVAAAILRRTADDVDR